MWSYERPYDEAPELKDRIAFYWNKMERRYEEVFVYLRAPAYGSTYSRVRVPPA